MESENLTDPYEDNRHVDQSRQSLRSTKNDSQTSSFQKHEKIFRDKNQGESEKDICVESRSKTRTWRSDPHRDQVSDEEGRRSTGSLYSEDYDNGSHSGRSISPYSRSRTPSLTRGVRNGVPQRGVRAKRISNSPFYKTGGVGRRGVSRPQRPGGQPLTQQHRRGVRSRSKESTPPKDLDLVTKRMLSARLLKINELRNSLAELQQRTDELQKENRVLRQLQVRQEKALHRYDDTESEISQLLSRHTNETHVLRERLRRTQERERAAERRMKDGEEQMQRSQATIARLKKLVDQRDLGARDELSRRLDEEKTRAQQAEHRIKELERSMELSSSSYQRQLAAERKKTIGAQEEIRTLQEELERLTNKLKEKERELDAKNIYANRMMKPEKLRKDVDSGAKRKVPSRSSTKAVQTKDRASSLDFPTPPPAISDANECSEQAPDEYLSLKEFDRVDRRAETEDRHQKLEQQKMRDRGKEGENEEKRKVNRELNVLEEKAKTPRDSWEKKKEQDDSKRTTESSLSNQEEDNNRKHIHVQEEVERWNHGALANQQAAEEAHRKKQQLLAKMREIDRQEHGAKDPVFESSPSEFNQAPSNQPSPRLPEQRNQNSHIFNLTESEELASLRAGAGSGDGVRRRSGMQGGAATAGFGKREPRTQISKDDLAFGNYAPSFGHSASRGSLGFPPPPPKEDRESALEAIGVFSLRGVEKEKEAESGAGKEKKSSLMQQLFGALATPVGDGVSASNTMEVLNSPPTTNGVRSRREGLLSFHSGSSTPPSSSLNTLHVTDGRPAIRAIASFDDDIEELTL
ncbi:lebercilin [Cyclopterus lumpus]|uniref:lebercilin n=1 Tax=Cyclopterus lumpus TaxID=8103 RepID=UPI00148645D2|nr:lebercilin [Cyclopterus lumpus]XP_034383621.1 lebercilin [Cyclopterus lumpus]XP_034383622.1 lebercilin [Cyclopterus lumpus]XP_034383623.1 lebercilin [Cyclopterus lumpus]XP_034383624.1 lebercilin [Cyclopterus lumpus]